MGLKIFNLLFVLSPMFSLAHEPNCALSHSSTESQLIFVETFAQKYSGPDLAAELKSINQSGAKIKWTYDQDGRLKVFRDDKFPMTPTEEMKQRQVTFELFKKINLAKDADLSGDWQRPNEKVIELFRQFAMTDAGAVWMRLVTNDTIEAINRGYLEINTDLKDGTAKLSDLLTGETSDDGKFAADFTIFKIYSFSGKGAKGSSGSIGINSNGIGGVFPSTGQKIDPLAILSHEFGHTRYGDPRSGEDLQGEARTVTRFENPVRTANGYDERLIYCDPGKKQSIQVKTGVIRNSSCTMETN